MLGGHAQEYSIVGRADLNAKTCQLNRLTETPKVRAETNTTEGWYIDRYHLNEQETSVYLFFCALKKALLYVTKSEVKAFFARLFFASFTACVLV